MSILVIMIMAGDGLTTPKKVTKRVGNIFGSVLGKQIPAFDA